MTTLYWIGGLIAVALFLYLMSALIRPESF
jgi:K+-transporting ATPase KdpF subunit